MLKNGVPHRADYDEVLESPVFSRMERFSNTFIATNQSILRGYAGKWVVDPLHQWSRQWEYPFVFVEIQRGFERSRGAANRVLDAGSGFTFFPYYLESELGCNVTCADLDKDLKAVFESAGTRLDSQVSFTPAGISSLPFEDASFDVIYCVSVLEHTHDYPDIIREFRRLLAPGGRLIVTFDISLDGDRDISPPAADALLRELSDVFPDQSHSLRTVAESIENTDILTTHDIAKRDVELLPWRSPLIPVVSSIRRGRLPRRWLNFPLLSCYCVSYSA